MDKLNEMKTEWKSVRYDNPRGMWLVFPGLCKGCGLCIHKCPTKVINWSKELGVYGTPRVEPKMEGCIVCGMCQMVCPDCAIRIEKKSV